MSLDEVECFLRKSPQCFVDKVDGVSPQRIGDIARDVLFGCFPRDASYLYFLLLFQLVAILAHGLKGDASIRKRLFIKPAVVFVPMAIELAVVRGHEIWRLERIDIFFYEFGRKRS